MKKVIFLFLLAIIPFASKAQFFSVGGQYAQKSDGQFFTSFSYPVYKKKNALNSFIASGVEYTTYGGAKLSGLNLKPIQINTFFGERFFNTTKYTFMMGVDAGYLFNLPKGHKDCIVVTPNIYFDYKLFFVKAGYDFDLFNGKNQFFVRAGVCFGMGALKMIPNTKIW